jgi:hypothetical protein
MTTADPIVNRVEDDDWFLQFFVTLANHGAEFGITLQVAGGHLVSGMLTSGRTYGQQLADALQPGQLGDAVREMFERAYPDPGDADDDEAHDERDPPPRFIHLRDARFFHAGGTSIPNNEAVLWRGRVSQVAGFSLGQLSTDQPGEL